MRYLIQFRLSPIATAGLVAPAVQISPAEGLAEIEAATGAMGGQVVFASDSVAIVAVELTGAQLSRVAVLARVLSVEADQTRRTAETVSTAQPGENAGGGSGWWWLAAVAGIFLFMRGRQ